MMFVPADAAQSAVSSAAAAYTRDRLAPAAAQVTQAPSWCKKWPEWGITRTATCMEENGTVQLTVKTCVGEGLARTCSPPKVAGTINVRTTYQVKTSTTSSESSMTMTVQFL